MSEDILSQDEIDALLNAGEPEGERRGVDADALSEVLHVTLKAGLEALAVAGGGAWGLGEGRLERRTPAEWLQDRPGGVVLPFTLRGAAQGRIALVLPLASALALAGKIRGEAVASWSQASADALAQGAVAVAGGLGETMSAILVEGVSLEAGEPVLVEGHELPQFDGAPLWIASYELEGEFGPGPAALFIPESVAGDVMAKLEAQLGEEAAAAAPAPAGRAGGGAGENPAFVPSLGRHETARRTPASMVRGSAGAARPAEFGSLGAPQAPADRSNIDLILDVPLQITVELGRAQLQIREILDLGKGSVVELDKLAGEPVDIYVNGKLIARGEVVVMDENFGVKISDIVSRVERVHNLQQ